MQNPELALAAHPEGWARREGSTTAFRARLRDETRVIHDRIERALPLLNRQLTLEEYCGVLERFLGLYEPLERALAASARPHGFRLSCRAARLEADLRSLGRSPARIASVPRCAALPRYGSAAEAAGGVYVVEGAALGGQVIGRALERSLGEPGVRAASFFRGEGGATGSRFRAVLGWLEGFAASAAEADAVVRGATATFLAFERWLGRAPEAT